MSAVCPVPPCADRQAAGAVLRNRAHQAALQLLEAVMTRWGGYLRDVLR